MAQSWYRETWGSVALATVIAAGGGLVLGGLTSFGQTVLPAWVNSLSNSAGGWTAIAFLLVWLGRARPLLGAVLGVVAFEALVEGYAAVSGWRGFFYQAPFSGFYSLMGLLLGPVIGATAAVTRYGSPRSRTLAVTPLAAVLMGEGLWGLLRLTESTSPVYWAIELVAGPIIMALVIVRLRPGRRVSLLASALVILGAAALFGVYGMAG